MGIHEIYQRIGERVAVTVIAPTPSSAQSDEATPPGASYQVAHFGSGAAHGLRSILDRAVQRLGLAQVLAVIRAWRRDGADVINCHFVKRNTLVIAFARLAGIPVALSLVGRSDVFASLSTIGRWHAAVVMRSATVVIPNSGYYLEGSSFANRAVVIPYGVNINAISPGRRRVKVRAELGYSDGEVVVVAVQRLVEVKRVDLVIRALARALASRPELRLVVAGRGPAEDALRRLVAELGVEAAVSFTGYISFERLTGLLGAADLFASHSEAETFGVMFAEAMAAGLPVVAADTSCVRYVLTSDCSVIVPAYRVESFAQALVDLAANPERRNAMAVAGRRRAVAEYDWHHIAARYRRTIHGIVVPDEHAEEAAG